MTLKTVFGKCSLFVLLANGWKDQTWTLSFPARENPNMEKALFDWPIVLQYDVKAKYRLFSRKFSGMKFFHPRVPLTNQKPGAFVSVRQTNQKLLFPFVCCFCCSRVFISRSYENRSIRCSMTSNGTGLEQVVHTHRTSCRSNWPRRTGALNLSPHSWIFTSVSVGSSRRSYLFTSAAFGITVHSPLKCGTEPVRYRTLHFRDRCVVASLRRRK